MLPEKISNEICSLEPKKKKRAFSIIFTIDKKGNVQKKEQREQQFIQTTGLHIQMYKILSKK